MTSILIGFILTLFSCQTNTAVHDGYHINDVAEDFSLMNIDGNMVSMADYPDAKGFIVVFTCNHCPFAVMYEDRLNDLYEMYNDQGIVLLAINPNDPEVKPDDSFENMKVRAEEKGFKFPYLMDEGQKIYPKFGATKTPHVYILDAAKKVHYIGAIDDSARDAEAVEERYVENAIASLLKGESADPAETKAIGCSIKTK